MIRVHLSVPNPDGSHLGVIAHVEVVPRVGEEVLLADALESDRRFVVAGVRHVLFVNLADSTAGAGQVEVTLALP